MTGDPAAGSGDTRWLRAFHLLFYACLASAAGVAALRGGPLTAGTWTTLGLSGLMAAWHGFFVARRPELMERPHPMGWHLLVLVALLFVLIGRDSVYEIVMFGMFPIPYVLLPAWWGHAGAVLLVGSASVSSALADPEPSSLLGQVAGGALVLFLGQFVRHLIRHSEQSHVVGVLEERARLAREIHDTLAQGFSGIIAQLEAAEQGIDDREAVRRRIALAKRLARDSLNEARRSVDALRPEPLERDSLDRALGTVAGRWSGATGVPVTVSVHGLPRPLPAEAETTILRAAQESLANVARHASARHVALTLSYMDDEVTLDVLDDGVGFDGMSTGGGYGLTAMGERAARSGGSVTVESTPGEGTAVCLTIPCA
ncbi:sensor histidine kinase [Nonomuraea sp. K274]|uniref:Oxygen sensor histidine kinase NreB n=1 Tax=Nonomuraea cypriaca TaxID=1187855 RepID=A0A931EWB0_9ACTN|nr:sensor histidine kinase [Nonomuraea cypriaca]MBF8185030.1 sensor histidine kinase [Nonomuraea cypriaca]